MNFLIPLVIAIQILVGIFAATGINNTASNKILGDADTTGNDQSTTTPEPSTTEALAQPTETPQETVTPQITTETPTQEVTPSTSPQTSPSDNGISQSTTETPQETVTPEASEQPSLEQTSSTVSPIPTEISPTVEVNVLSGEENNNGHNSFQKDINTSIDSLDTAVFHDATEKSPSDKISEHIVLEVKTEEDQLNNAKTPEEKINILSQSVNNNIASINTDLKNNRLEDLAFSSARLSYQIDKTIDTMQTLNQSEAGAIKNQINSFCKNTDYVLRSSQLLVPEDTEQAMEITRGKCFNLQP